MDIHNLKCVCSYISRDIRARPDWAYEFPDRTGLDTQICRTGPAGPDWIRTYTFQHFTYQLQVIYSHIWCHKLLNLISKQKKKNLKFFFEKRGFTVRRPGRKTSGFQTVRILKICRTSGPDVMSGRALRDIRPDQLEHTLLRVPIKL
jgi:hypothetical protein